MATFYGLRKRILVNLNYSRPSVNPF